MGLGLDIIIFISSALFGIFMYWRESNGNKLYRFVNKLAYSKELQMKPDNPKGFIYKQSFLPRIIFIITLALISGLIIQFVTPLQIFTNQIGLSIFFTFIVGTTLGTYLATLVIKSTKIIEENSEVASDILETVVEKGKDIIEDLKPKEEEKVEPKDAEKIQEKPKEEKKSARERLKDKGLM